MGINSDEYVAILHEAAGKVIDQRVEVFLQNTMQYLQESDIKSALT